MLSRAGSVTKRRLDKRLWSTAEHAARSPEDGSVVVTLRPQPSWSRTRTWTRLPRCAPSSPSSAPFSSAPTHARVDVRSDRLSLLPVHSCRERERAMGESAASCGEAWVQNVVVMRHGDRIDSVEPEWLLGAARPWDPPLTEEGKIRAWDTGKRLRAAQLGFSLDRVVVSPFLRCLQTAGEVVAALCADEGGVADAEFSRGAPIDPSRVKVSMEYGLCEILSRLAIRVEVPKDGNWFPDISELEALLPPGTVDHSVGRVYQELPQWEEPLDDARQRYQNVILTLANRYPNENLLLVTHGECVDVATSAFAGGVTVRGVEFCARSHLRRKVTVDDNDSKAFTAEAFKMLTENGKTGVMYLTLQK